MILNYCGSYKSLDEMWLDLYNVLLSDEECGCSRDGALTGEILNCVAVLENPLNNIMQNKLRNLSIKYAIGEMLWYMSRSRELKEIQKYTKGWDRMSDDGKLINSNYGWCIKDKFGFDQWEFVKNELIKDSSSRRAVIHIKEPSNKESNDVNCTVSLQFFIRQGKLYMTTYMRSNDIWFGLPYDVFQFTCYQILLSMELGLELGTYTHMVGSLHLYERNVK